MPDFKKFLSKDNAIAIVGATNDESKWGYKLLKKMKESGFNVIPVNPKYDEILDLKAYKSLKEIVEKVDVVMTVVPPQITEKVVVACIELNIKKIWMQPGSESDNAVKYCNENEIELIHNACFVADGMKEGF